MDYQITTTPQKTMFGKRTGSILAKLESNWSGNVASAAGPNATAAKQALINHLARIASNDQRAYLFCGDDVRTVFVVSFAHDSWQYDIISADRNHPSGCIMPGVSSFNEAKTRAHEHADQCFNGVIKIL